MWIVSVLKVLAALRHRTLPASLHVTLNLISSMGRDPNSSSARERTLGFPCCTAFAGVSFGIGGTNVHVILGEARIVESAKTLRENETLLAISAKTIPALRAYVEKFVRYRC